jgi:hypothetical protein
VREGFGCRVEQSVASRDDVVVEYLVVDDSGFRHEIAK